MDILPFWGKARPEDADRGPGWHPLAFHGLDVAAAGEALLEADPGLAARLAGLFGMGEREAAGLLRFLLCLHDIGKFARKFQAKVPERFPPCFGIEPTSIPTSFDHGAGGLRLFIKHPGVFGIPAGKTADSWLPIVSAVAGHHGAPPDPPPPRDNLRPDFGRQGIEAARLFADEARRLLAPPEPPANADRDRLRRASFLVAGLAVLADWIGSRQEWFPYRAPDDFSGLDAYWEYARGRAKIAIREVGVEAAAPAGRLGYGDLIGRGAAPGPMQRWAGKVELPDGPALFVVEDETGSGKTEAAAMLAHRLMAARRANGFYFALPTMATANAMFDRLGKALPRLFADGETPSLALAHGARDLHPGFRSAMAGFDRADAGRGSNYGDGDGAAEIAASAACASWIADDRRRAFLADAGAGTVDQAILAALPSRHQSLRLLGLAQRVLVLDEVHAYDAYMQREIEALLTFQAALGGSAILLSATLPAAHRRGLADAFAEGLGEDAPAPLGETAYPLATVRARGRAVETPVPGRPGRGRRLPVRFLRRPEDALAEVERAAREGRAALYIRNTVDDALEAHAELAARGIEADLFHARFALADRLEIERRIVEAFGKASEAEGRAGKVLVATQVVEQSLDLDFDAMASDLAPIDLLVQRAGRLWRHDRPERADQPELLVVAPAAEEDAAEDWCKALFPRAAHVYRDHARLWLTARTLEEAGAIETPGGLRALIEAVYGPEAEARVPPGLRASLWSAEGKAGADRGVANMNTLKLSPGYVRDAGAWDSDVRTPTRLADDPSATLRLARARGGRIEPYAAASAPGEPWRAWRLSEVDVSQRHATGEAVPPRFAEAAREAKAGWGRHDADKILAVLEEDGDGRLAGAVMGPERERVVSYSPGTGLAFGPRAE